MFSKFSDFRKEVFEIIREYREHFVQIVLKKHGVIYDNTMKKRDIREMFDKRYVGIIKDERLNMDKIYIEGNLIGYWNRNYEYHIKNGRMLVKIEYCIHK